MSKLLIGTGALALLAIAGYYVSATYATIKNVKRKDGQTGQDVLYRIRQEEREKLRTKAYVENMQAQANWNNQSNQREEIYLMHNMKRWNDEE